MMKNGNVNLPNLMNKPMPSPETLDFSPYQLDVMEDDPRWEQVCPDYQRLCEEACYATLENRQISEHISSVELTILLTSDEKMQQLNRDFRGKDAATNVLSFPTMQLEAGHYAALKEYREQTPLMLGDIAIGLETVEREAVEQSKILADHLQHLVVHSTLHVLGYDHENDTEAAVMEGLEVSILRSLNVADPYRNS